VSDTIDESLEKWKEKTEGIVDKLPISFTICGCKGTVVTAEDGKRHIELECKSKSDRDEAAAIFEEEIILRVNPKVVLEELAPEPVTES